MYSGIMFTCFPHPSNQPHASKGVAASVTHGYPGYRPWNNRDPAAEVRFG